MSAQDPNSQYFEVQSSGTKKYSVTINYNKGHWCTCPGMISKKGTFDAGAGRTSGTSCKHINKIINQEFDGDWGTPQGEGNPRIPRKKTKEEVSPPAPFKPTGRAAAVLATRARKEKAALARAQGSSLPIKDRIAALESAKGGATS